jgi:hypothetical protein
MTDITLSKHDLAAIAAADPRFKYDGFDDITFTIVRGVIVDCKATATRKARHVGKHLTRAARHALARYHAQQRGQQCQVIQFKKRGTTNVAQ